MCPAAPLRQGLVGRATQLGADASPFRLHGSEPQAASPDASDDNEVDAGRKKVARAAKALAAEALDAIAHDCVADLSRDDQAQAGGARCTLRGGLRRGLVGDQQHEMRRHDAARVGLDAQEVPALAQSSFARKGMRAQDPRTGVGLAGGHAAASAS
jgi:hypothetical protein